MQSDDRKAPVWAGDAALRALGLVDWTATALGDPNGWPAPLRMAAGMVLNSPHPMCLAWGEREVLLHNEALGALLGSRVQGAQGQPFGGLWSDLQSALQPAMKSAWAGQALRCGDVPVVVSRHGRIESACFDFSWSPVHGEAGDVDGLLCAVVETTARMQAERALSHAQARAGNVLQGMDEAFMLLDADFRIEQINGAVALMDGRPASEIVGRTHWDVWPLSIGTELERGYRHAMAHRQHVVMEQRVPPRGVGKNALPGLRLEIRVHPIENGLAVFTRDVSPRKRAEERQRALLELGDRVRDLDDPRAILSTAAEIGGRALRVSRAGYAVVDTGGEWAVVETDWTRAEVPSVAGRHWLSSFGPTFLDNLRHGETIAVSDVSADERTSASIDSFGKIGVRALLNIPLIERGRLSAILFLHEQEPRDWLEEDIALWTEIGQRAWAAADRARAKAALRALNETLHASETRFRQLAELGPSLIWLGHRDGSLSYVNDRWIEYSGQSRDEALPWGWAAVVHADDIDALRAAWADARARAGIYQTEARLRRRDGQYRWYLIRATPLLDDGQEHDGQAITWLGANTDIHEHKTAEKATAETLRRTEDALRQSQKM
ncbi:MAG: hypothetical protein JWP52_3150, partial [Rhizobacter sp.]|nr:hypothetical protein [Rhizobacter sp.]